MKHPVAVPVLFFIGALVGVAALGSFVAPTTQPPADASCRSDWRFCKSNDELVNTYSDYSYAQASCQTAATGRAKYGSPSWPWLSFSTYHVGTDYAHQGWMTLIENDAQFQNAFGAMAHTRINCDYNLGDKQVIAIFGDPNLLRFESPRIYPDPPVIYGQVAPAPSAKQQMAPVEAPTPERSRAYSGPGFDCTKAAQPLPRLICSSPELSRTDLLFNQAYQALRQQLAPAGQRQLAQDDLEFLDYVKRFCGVPEQGPVAGSPDCVAAQYDRQRAQWLSRLSGPAREEANRPIEQHLAVQADLQRLGFLAFSPVGRSCSDYRRRLPSFRPCLR